MYSDPTATAAFCSGEPNAALKIANNNSKPEITIMASAAGSVTAARAAMNQALIENPQLSESVSKVLQGYSWNVVPPQTKYVFSYFCPVPRRFDLFEASGYSLRICNFDKPLG